MVALCSGCQWWSVLNKMGAILSKTSFRMFETIAIAITNHSKNEPLEIQTLKCSVFLCSVFKPPLYLIKAQNWSELNVVWEMSFANFNELFCVCRNCLKKRKRSIRCDATRCVVSTIKNWGTSIQQIQVFIYFKKNFSRALDLSNTVGIRIPD